MVEQGRAYYRGEEEVSSEASAAAIAYNKNYNILYAPDSTGYDMDKAADTDSSRSAAAGQGIDDLMKKILDKDEETAAKAKASGKASIENTNLNFIITI